MADGHDELAVDEDTLTLGGVEIDAKLRRIYLLTGIAWLFHAVGDPLVTYLAVAVFEVGYETNPLLRPSLNDGAMAFAVANLPLVVGGLLGIAMFTLLLQTTAGKGRERTYWFVLGGLSVIVLWGVGLVAWNLFVLVSGV